jgi:hypothetical protein
MIISPLNKSQLRQIDTLHAMLQHGMTENVALGLSALIRSAMKKSQVEKLMMYAFAWDVVNHPDFKV